MRPANDASNDVDVPFEHNMNNSNNTNTIDPSELQEAHYRVLLFLWGVITEKTSSLKPCPLILCHRNNTQERVHNIYATYLGTHPDMYSTPTRPIQHRVTITLESPTPHEFSAVANQVERLADALHYHFQDEAITRADTKASTDLKKFNKLPLINRNTILLFTLNEDQDQCDVAVMQPTKNFLQIIQNNSIPSVQGQLR